MSDSLLRRILREHQMHRRTLALILCLSMVVSLGTFAGLRKDAVAKTYTRVVLECPYMADGAAQVVHTHNDDCYDEYGNLACTLPEIEAHVHDDACYTEVKTPVCGLEENPGHAHSEACYTLTLSCGEEEREEVLDEEGNVLDPGHTHSPACYTEVLTCGVEEGEGAHVHTDECYLTDRVLTCSKPEIIPHTHTDDCYQKNEDGSIYVDENGYSWLTCGQQEIIEHVHDVNCFKVYELDDGEPEETYEAGEEIAVMDETTTKPASTEVDEKADDPETSEEKSAIEETDDLTESEETKPTDTEADVPAVAMPAQSFEKTAGGIKVSVEAPEGAFPENTRMSVKPVNGNSLKDTVSEAVAGEVLEVQAVDITFYDAEGREIEPATAIRVSITPADSQYAQEQANVVHIDSEGAATAVEQAEGTTEDNSELVFDADAFSIYAVVYTVHFEYEVNGQVYTASVPGAQDKYLSELIRELHVVGEEQFADFMTKISEVGISNPEVLKITETEGDWTIRPLKDSDQEEALTIVMQDGASFCIAVEAEGITEVSTEDETAVISTVNELYLPEKASATSEMLDEEKGESAIAAVQQTAEPDAAATGTNYQVFSIGLENVDVEAYDGFNVSVSLPEDTVIGRDFQLYQVKEDGTATDITESLAVTSQTTEDGLQNVSVLSFTTDSFADYVLSYSIETYYTDYKGDTFKITLNYGPKAGIPDGAELKVKEILPGDEAYQQYLDDSAAKLGVESNAVSFARFFDIEILKGDEKIEPLTPVQVTISLSDISLETIQETFKVLHFNETGIETAEKIRDDQITDEAIELSFEAYSFSVYGVITEPAPQGENDLGGKFFMIKGSGGYLGKESATVDPFGIVKVSNPDEAAILQFEVGSQPGKYYISTVIGDKKQYLSLINPQNQGGATAVYSDDKQEFSVTKSGNYYRLQGGSHYLNEWNGSGGNQFSGWWFGDVDNNNMTLEPTVPVTESGKQYAVIVKYNNHYYSVFNDGTLRQVDSVYDPVTNRVKVEMDYPLVWNYTSGHVAAHSEGEWWQPWLERYPDHDFDYTNLSIPAEASGFYGNHLPNGYYNRYIDPTAADATSEEDSSNPDLREGCTITYGNNHISAGNNYIGISSDGLHIIGNATETTAAEIYLAEITVPGPENATHDNHMVNHIDIAIAGNSTIKIPLAYGDYYDKNDNVIFTANKENHFLEMTPSIPLSTDDMKKATITASAIENGVRVEKDDVFYVTGYSQNDKTSPTDLDQIRIEGSFKVSNIDPYQNADNVPDVREARKANPIDYTITVTKPITVELEYKGQKLYTNNGQKMVYEIPITLSASFNYWQNTNKCPPLHINYDEHADFVQDWKDGKIVGGVGNDLPAMSGMDFDLGTVAADDQIRKPAIEITKIIVDENGNFISSTTPHDVDVDVYYKEKDEREEDSLIGLAVDQPISNSALTGLTAGYEKLHTKNVAVGSAGFGLTNDYDIREGLIYVKENEKSVDRYLTGTDGVYYQYVRTRMETEYAWRTDGDEGKIHNADGNTSVPEVLGYYLNEGKMHEGKYLDNTFLEFFVYNVYKEVETVDVPVDKTWYSSEDSSVQLTDDYTWTSTFVLEEMEVHESGPVSSEANTSVWRVVDGVSPITISNGDSESARTFAGLPKYRYYDVDGEQSVYRIMYSVDETAYELKQNGTTISKWDKNNGLTVGDVQYTPHWPHDAGDANDESGIGPNDANFYHVIVENHKKDETVIEILTDLKLQKQWPEGALEEAGVLETDAYATFQLKRYVTTEFVEYDSSEYNPNVDCTVKLYGQNNELLDQVTVKKGAKMKIAATFTSQGSIHFMFNGNSNNDYQIQWYSGDNTVSSTSFTVVEDLIITPTSGQYYTPSWSGAISGAKIEYYSSSGVTVNEDTDYTNEQHYYTVNRAGGWIETINNLPLYSESSVNNNQKHIYHYSYYFTEVDSNPSGFYAEFTDGSGNPIGDASHRVTADNTTVTATNKKIPDFYVKKEWYNELLPDYFPEVRVSLYQGVIQNGQVQQGSLYDPDGDGHFTDIPLNRDNKWTWNCDRYLPETNGNGDPVGYYIVENSTGNSVNLYDENGELITVDSDHTVIRAKIGGGNSNGYYNSESSDPKQNPWDAGLKQNTGTLFVANQVSKNYTQFDVKKKIIEYVDDGTGNMRMDTTTAHEDRMRNRYLLMKVMRLTTSSPTYVKGNNSIVIHDWEDYGVPFVVGYDDTGAPYKDNPNSFDLDEGTSAWMWTIKEDMNSDGSHSGGLPVVGFYLDPSTGHYRQVYYYYLLEEIEAYSDKELTTPLITDGYEWYVALEPEIWGATRTEIFPKETGQDQDRIMNIQASNLIVEKDWTQDTDVQEVYVKIYRTPKSSQNIDDMQGMDDVTWDIASRTYQYPDYGVVPASNISDPTFKAGNDNLYHGGVLILRPDDGPITVNQILFRDPKDSYEFCYYIEEVGFKDKYGIVRSIEEKFVPQYDYWDRANSQWAGRWQDNAANNNITIGTKNNNKLRVRNVPTLSIEAKKEWYDADGNKLDGPWDGITPDPASSPVKFSIIQTMQQYVDGNPVGNATTRTLTFGGTEELTIESTSKLLQAIVSQSGSYQYTVTREAAPADTENWTTIVDGLQKHYIDADGKEYRFTYEVKEKSEYNNCVTSVINGKDISGNATCIIKNEKTDTSLAIEKIFAGSVQLTDEQKQKITFTVTGKFDGSTETSRVFTYGKDGVTVNGVQQEQENYKWVDGVLTIKNIQPGNYIVTEYHDDIEPYAHTRTYVVTKGTVENDCANATVVAGERTLVTITNKYDNSRPVDVKILKVDAENTATKLDGAKFELRKKDTVSGTYLAYVKVNFPDSPYENNGDAEKEITEKDEGITFTGLTDGEYRIVETVTPPGYIKTTEVAIDFTVSGGTITYTFKDADNDGKADDNPYIVRYSTEEATNDKPATFTFTVGNTPGKPLPMTGGVGTGLFTALGGLMTATAGAILTLTSCRRRKKQVS